MWVFFICSSLRKQALCWKGHKLWQDGRKVFANRLHRSRCFPLKYVSSLDSNPPLRIVCQFIAVKAWTMLRKPLVRREKGTIHFSARAYQTSLGFVVKCLSNVTPHTFLLQSRSSWLLFLWTWQGQVSNPETPGYVGFANLPNQVHRKSVKKGFEFTLMVVGEWVIAALQHRPLFFPLSFRLENCSVTQTRRFRFTVRAGFLWQCLSV